MAQTGFTPIQLYRTTTASAVPVAGNLAAGELAINLTDKKLYAKDASNNVFLLADASSGSTTAANLAGGAAGSLPYQTGANATTFRAIGTAGQVLQVNSGATAPEWVNSSGTGNVARTTSPSFTTPSLGAATATSINGLTLTSSTGALTVANGKTLTANSTLTLAGVDGKTLTVNSSLTLTGTDATTMTFPTTSATLARTDAGQTFTGTQTFLSNPVLDAGTANGVLFLNGGKVVSSGSALTFDGTNLSTTGSVTSTNATTGFVTNASNGFVLFSGDPANYNISRSGTTVSVKSGGNVSLIAGNTSPITFNAFGSEQMRLTSTGLGIGTSSPGAKLDVRTSLSATSSPQWIADFYPTTSGSTDGTYGGGIRLFTKNPNGNYWPAAVAAINDAGGSNLSALGFYTGTAGPALNELMRLDSSGNLGLGVTPSAVSASDRVLQVRNFLFNDNTNGYGILRYNNFFNGTNDVYLNTGAVSAFQMQGNSFKWYQAPSGTAGNAISFSQVMTLDASGRLLLGTTLSTGATMDIQGSAAGALTVLNIQNTSIDVAAISRLAIGSQGANWFIDNERNGGFLKFSRGASLYLTMDNVGNIIQGSNAIATNATNGFLYVPGCAGTPTGTPTAYTGRVPIVVDTTNNKLYFYSGGQWRDAGP